MRSQLHLFAALCMFLLVTTASAQRSFTPYPIIFVHGLLGSDKTWTDATSAFSSIYGDYVPTRQDDIGTVIHAMLNRYKNSTNVFGSDGVPGTADDDVFVNPKLPLSSGVYTVNFETSWNEDPKNPVIFPNTNHWIIARESQSNQSAVVKQGYALKQSIQLVLNATGAKKVILVGHSMGGIAIREYLQRHHNGKPRWWVDPTSDDGHCVAKVVTISSPHLGSDVLKWIPIRDRQSEVTPQVLPSIVNTSCEAIRDLRITYASGTQWEGVYLFGGRESGLNTNWLLSGWHNADVDCNGREDDVVEGIHPSLKGKHPLPVNVRYTYIAARFGLFSGDLLVDFDRQYLAADSGYFWPKGCADTIQSGRDHWTVVSDIPQLVRGLDEPASTSNAYEIGIGMRYHGVITVQPGGGVEDIDVFTLPLDTAVLATSTLRFNISDTAVMNRTLTWTICSSRGDTVRQLQTDPTRKQLTFELKQGEIATLGKALYLSVSGQAAAVEWKHPYAFVVDRISSTRSAPKIRGLIDTTITNTDTLFDSFSVDYDNDNELDFSVTSSDSTLISPDNVSIVGSGSQWTMKIVPLANAVGTVRVRVTCSDELLSAKLEDYDITLIRDTVVRGSPVIYGLRDATIKNTDTLVDEFRVAYDAADQLKWSVISMDTSLISSSNLTLLGEDRRLALQIVPNPGSVGSAEIHVVCNDSMFTSKSTFRVTVVQDSLPSRTPVISSMVDTTITTSDTLMQDVRVDYEDPEELQWTATSLNTDVIPSSNISFVQGGEVNVLRVVPLKTVTGSASIRVTCRDSTHSASAVIHVVVVDDTVTSVNHWVPCPGPAMSVRPIPAIHDEVSVVLHVQDERAYEIAIVDYSGRTVATQPIATDASSNLSYTINTSSLPSGGYRLHLRTNRGVHVAPMVVVR